MNRIIAIAIAASSALAPFLSGRAEACTGSTPAVGCPLPEHQAPKLPSDVSQLAGNDEISVTPYGGNLVVRATDVSLPSVGGFALHVSRTYHSTRLLLSARTGELGALDPDFERHMGPMGLGWTFHYGVIWYGESVQMQGVVYEHVDGQGISEAFYPNDGDLTAFSAVGSGSTFVSKNLSVLRVDPSNQDRLYVHQADGLRYTYDRLVSIMNPGSACAGSVTVQGVTRSACWRFVPTEIRDLSGNTWSINYDLDVQEYKEHPIITAISSSDGRKLDFIYSSPGGGAPRAIDSIKLDSTVLVTYGHQTDFGRQHVLTSVSTPEGRTTSFSYNRSGSGGSPDADVYGLLIGIESPLGGGTGIVYVRRAFRAPTWYPERNEVQAVDRLLYDTSGVVTSSADLEDRYVYSDTAAEFVATITHFVNGQPQPQATRTIHHEAYPTAGCGDLDRVGLVVETELASRGDTIREVTAYSDPLEVSSRAVNYYCSQTKPKIYRVEEQVLDDSSTGLSLTTTPSAYDYVSPTVVTRSDGVSLAATYQNIVDLDRFALGLPKTSEAKLGNATLNAVANTYYTGSSNHLVHTMALARDGGHNDTFSFTYYTTGPGRLGAVKDSTRDVLKTTYDYEYGVVASVSFPGGSKLSRARITKRGVYASEKRRGVTTAFTWDGDLRVTSFAVAGKETVNVAYCSQSQTGCSSNFYCIGRDAACGGTASVGDRSGKRVVTFDELGRKVSEQDWIAGGSISTKTWSGFDFAHLPTTYVDPVRGAIDLTYDVGGRLVSEALAGSGPTLTSVVRNYAGSTRIETTTKRGLTMFDIDDWAGRPLVRGFQRAGEARIDMNYTWTPVSEGWKSTISSTAWGTGFEVEEVYDFAGRLVSEKHPEIGLVTHSYDGRGFLTQSYFPGLGYRLCHVVNAEGQITETRKNYSGGCPSGELITEASYDAATTRLTSITRKGGRFNPGLSVTRTYTDPDAAGRDQSLTVKIPRALDAPAPWQGAELFPQAPDSVDAFRSAKLAFTTIEEIGSTDRYEIEIRALAGARSLMPTYDWGGAQTECEEAGLLARGPWGSGNVFDGSEIEAYVKNADPTWDFDVQPNTLYCWRVRAVRCHDGAACQRAEVSPAGLWGVFAFNNPVATPASQDGWDQIPTNHNLNVEETYLPCIGMGCPNVAKRGGATVDLTVDRVFNLAGNATSIQYPTADSTLEAWARGGSSLAIARNHLGDPAKLTLTLPGAQSHVLAEYTRFAVDGQPEEGTIHTRGYNENLPGAFNLVQTPVGDLGHATAVQPSIDLSWDYDADGRLTQYSAMRDGKTLYGISNIQYTGDSLVSSWTRSDSGLEGGSYSAGYDARGQLTSYTIGNAQGSGTATYHYDANGNLTSRTGQIGLSGLNVYSYDNGRENRLTNGRVDLAAASFGTFGANNRSQDPAITYDAEGRIVVDHGLQLIYAHDDRIETVRGPNGLIERQMLYDGEGNLVRLIEGHQAHYYLYDETGRLLYEEVHDRWFYGSHFRDDQGRVVPNSRRYEHVHMGDSHIATVEHAAGVSSLAYHVRDWRDFEVVSLDADDAFVRYYHEPSPYGLETRVAGGGLAATATPLPAPHRLDLGIGGYQHNGWRTVDAWSGRFLRPDPARARHVRFPQGANLYANNLNNPLAYKDRDGDVPWLIPVAVVAYRVWSVGETVNDVITVVDLVTNPNTTTEQLISVGVAAAAGIVLGKIGGKIIKAGIKRFGNRAFKRAAKMLAKCDTCRDTCFVAGTPVHTLEGARAIETLEVGEGVETAIGGGGQDYQGEWVRVELEMPNPKEPNDLIRIALLRRQSWLDAMGIKSVGQSIDLTLSELAVSGPATVLAFDTRRVMHVPGRLVTGVFSHLNSDVYEISFVGKRASLRGTGAHPLYSLDRSEWVLVRDLRVGERLQAVEGPITVEALRRLAGVHRVFNLEVDGDHEYLVGDAGVRAHNACPWKTVVEESAVTKIVDKMDKTQREGFDKIVEMLAKGEKGRNQHALKGELAGKMAVDLPNTGGGRGALRVIFEVLEDKGQIIIHDITDYH